VTFITDFVPGFCQFLLAALTSSPSSAQEGTTMKKPTGKKTLGRKRKHARKRKMPAKAAYALPYTLEPHPEL